MNRPDPPPSPGSPLLRWISGDLVVVFAATGTTAHRICSTPEVWAERLGADVLISHQNEAGLQQVLEGLGEWGKATGFAPARIFGKYIPRQNAERVSPVLLSGDPAAPLTTVVEENGVRYGLDFGAGYSAGLFLDQRANRAFVGRSGVQRLLNTFAYTCSFSVVAAKHGAETVSVDLSKKSLDRGRENFALNSLPAAPGGRHRFLADDVLDVLPRLGRKGETFDIIILDPPTFSRGNKGRKFQVEQDMETLLQAALDLAAPRAKILLSTNCTRLNRRALETIARFSLKGARKTAEFHTEAQLPDIPSESAAQTLWLFLKS